MFSDVELLSIKICQTLVSDCRVERSGKMEAGGAGYYQQCSTLSSWAFLSIMLTFFCLLAQQCNSRILYMEFSIGGFIYKVGSSRLNVVTFVTMKIFMLHIFAYILEWDCLGVFFQYWSFAFFLTFCILEHLCTWRDMFVPFGPFSAEHAKIATYLVYPGNNSNFPRVLISNSHKGRNITTCMHLHVLLLSFLHIVDFIRKPINRKYSKELS